MKNIKTKKIYLSIAILLLLTAFARPSFATPPAVVGTWEVEIIGNGGKNRALLAIHADFTLSGTTIPSNPSLLSSQAFGTWRQTGVSPDTFEIEYVRYHYTLDGKSEFATYGVLDLKLEIGTGSKGSDRLISTSCNIITISNLNVPFPINNMPNILGSTCNMIAERVL